MDALTVYLTSPLDFSKTCRTCLASNGPMKPLYGACLNEMLQYFTNIQVQPNDGLPDLLCVQCILQCSRAYTFRQLCEKSDNILRQYITPEFQKRLQMQKAFVETTDEVEPVLLTEIVPIDLNDTDGVTNDDVIIINQSDQVPNLDDNNVSDEILPNTALTLSPTCPSSQPQSSSELVLQAEPTYACQQCNQVFSLKVNLKLHSLTHPKALIFVCEVCSKGFAEARILKRHLKTHLPEKPHKCTECGMAFADTSNLNKHHKKHTGELRNVVGKPHLCSVCGHAFKWSTSLAKHMKYHTGHKLLACEYCEKRYVEARSLRIHMRQHTGERPHSCDVCKKSFTQMCNLEKHMRIHTGERPFLCPCCGKGFAQSGYMRQHMRTHTGDKPHNCATCGKAFATSSTLAMHTRTHTGERPHVCAYCSKAFTRLEGLVVHLRTHTGDKPHVCSICGKAYISSSHLTTHMRTHTGDKPYACGTCQRRYATSNGLKAHQKTHVVDANPLEMSGILELAGPVNAMDALLEPQTLALECKLCGKQFTNATDLTQHLTEHNVNVSDGDLRATLNACGINTVGLKIETVAVGELATDDQNVHTLQVQTITI